MMRSFGDFREGALAVGDKPDVSADSGAKSRRRCVHKKTHVSMISMKNVRWKHFLYGTPGLWFRTAFINSFRIWLKRRISAFCFYPIVLTVITPSMPRIFSMIESSILFSTSMILYATFALFWLTIAAMFIFASARTVVI